MANLDLSVVLIPTVTLKRRGKNEIETMVVNGVDALLYMKDGWTVEGSSEAIKLETKTEKESEPKTPAASVPPKS